jgi:hypothetical protein
MSSEAFEWMGRIKAVEREYGAIRLGTDRLIAAVNDDPAILAGPVKRPAIKIASAHLEGTYLIRVFSEFETALRQFARTFHIGEQRRAETLINRVRDRGRIPPADATAVHQVREHRNVLVHDRRFSAVAVTIRDATRFLCRFLSHVQAIW